ncbi:unnamed protein product [Cuscuta epithymum]|uniref:Uncharacterized protein n=1 Tax=Cuscuta epithymum TaxID=186058 RepID=A0AAV0EUC2_9ASTE|nr:unnamed protein product [Cuscuta epithymum]
MSSSSGCLEASCDYFSPSADSLEGWVHAVLGNAVDERWGRFIVIIWSLWKQRNLAEWKEEFQGAAVVSWAADSMLKSWEDAQKLKVTARQVPASANTTWQKPQQGHIKINIDTAVNEMGRTRVWEWVTRNGRGTFIKAVN